MWDRLLHQLPPCRESSPPWLPVSAPPTGLDEYFFFNPWLSDFHTVHFSVSSGCFFFFKLLLPFFWLCKEAKCVYLHLHLGQKSSARNFHKWLPSLPKVEVTRIRDDHMRHFWLLSQGHYKGRLWGHGHYTVVFVAFSKSPVFKLSQQLASTSWCFMNKLSCQVKRDVLNSFLETCWPDIFCLKFQEQGGFIWKFKFRKFLCYL